MSITETAGFTDALGHRIAYVRHDAGGDAPLVVMAHGFKSSKIGPSRYFVPLARTLAARGVSTFRFDQPGSGDSEGVFEDSSFDLWVDVIVDIMRSSAAGGRRIALLGQSMGGTATVIAAARAGVDVAAVALWSGGTMPDRDPATIDPTAWVEEEGQRVRGSFWREAASSDVLGALARIDAPVYAVFGTADDFIALPEIRRFAAAARPGAAVRIIEGLPHSEWPFEHRTAILAETAEFLVRHLLAAR